MSDGVASTHFPYLPLTVTVHAHSATVEALLDTGFDGDVVVPHDFIAADEPPDGYLQWALADGSVVQAAAFLGTVMVGPYGPIEAVITVLGNEPIVGRSITDRFTIVLDHGQHVTVEP